MRLLVEVEASHRTRCQIEWFCYKVEVTEGYNETWIDGLNVFHNPKALYPLDQDLLPGAAHHYWQGDSYVVHFPAGHLENSTKSVIKLV